MMGSLLRGIQVKYVMSEKKYWQELFDEGLK
jgi:hypothetical protein